MGLVNYRKLLLAAGIGFGIVILTLTSLHFWVDSRLAQDIQKSAADIRLPLKIKSADLKFPFVIEIKDMGIAIPTSTILVPLFFDRIKIRPDFFKLITGSLNTKINANFYRGKILAKFSKSFWSDDVNAGLKAKKLRLENHPLFNSIGIKGLLSFKLQDVLIPKDLQQLNARFVIKLEDGNFDGGKIYGLVDLPKVSNISLYIIGKKRSSAIVFDKIIFKSSLGSARLLGRIDLDDKSQVSRLNFNGQIKLSKDGIPILSPYFALFTIPPAPNPEMSTEKNWHVEITKNPKNSSISYLIQPKN